MDISKYGAYFHDGSLYSIDYQDDQIIFTLSSAEMDPEEMKDYIPLENDRIKGKLHLKNIKNIKVNQKEFHGKLRDFL